MKNVKTRGIPRKKTNSAVIRCCRGNFAVIPQFKIPRELKHRGSARNSADRGKLWALIMSISIAPLQVTTQERSRFQYDQKGKFVSIKYNIRAWCFAAEYSAASTRKITSAAENIFSDVSND